MSLLLLHRITFQILIYRCVYFYKRLQKSSRLQTLQHHLTVGDGVLDGPPTNGLKFLHLDPVYLTSEL